MVLHRAVTGSTERFLGVLIEHFAGAFPTWLAPVQAMLVPITDRNHGYCQKLAARLTEAGLRVYWDGGVERMNAKIRKAQLSKIPYILVIGDREEEQGGAAVRLRTGDDLGAKPAAEIIELILAAVAAGN